MARRKVTMLEAFEASARESQERAALAQRRLAAEREKDARRDQATRSTLELRRRLGIGVGSLLGRQAGPEDPAAPSPEARSAAMPAPGPAAPSTARPAPPGGGAIPIDRRPALSTSWEAADEEASVREVVVGAPAPGALGGPDAPAAPDGGRSATGPATAEERAPAVHGLPPEEAPGQDLPPSLLRDSGESLSPRPPATFAVPMSGPAFAALAVAVLGSVFSLGLLLGGEDRAGAAPVRGRPAPAVAELGAVDRVASGEVSGGGPAEPAEARTAGGSAAGHGDQAPGGAGLTAAERRFMDPSMRFSVLAVTYHQNDANIALAYAAYDELVAAGFPAVRPYPWRSRVFLFVGAARELDELRELEARVKEFRLGSSAENEFRSAYVVNIADYRN